MSGFELAAGIAGLIAFTTRMLELLTGLTDSIPRSTKLLQSICNLRDVLNRVSSEYSLMLARLPAGDVNVTSSLLRRCVDDIHGTCQEYDVLLRKIRAKMGGLRQIGWKRSEGERVELDRRLESGKSTLSLLIASISAERQKHEAAAAELEKNNAASPPAYSPTAVPDTKPSFSSAAETASSSAPSEGVNWGLVNGVGIGGAAVGTTLAIATGPVGWFFLGMGCLYGAVGAGLAVEAAQRKGRKN